MREKWMGQTSVETFKIVQLVALRLLSEPVREQPVLASWQSLLDYLRADMAHLTIERVRTLYLNGKSMLIRDEVASEGSVDQAAIIYPRSRSARDGSRRRRDHSCAQPPKRRQRAQPSGYCDDPRHHQRYQRLQHRSP